MSARSAQPGRPREPGIFMEIVRDSKVSGEREHSVFYLIFENDCQRARFCKDVGGCKSNDLRCDAPSRANASFANAREA